MDTIGNLEANDASFDRLFAELQRIKKEQPHNIDAQEELIGLMKMIVKGSSGVIKRLKNIESDLEKEDSLKCLAMQYGQAKTDEQRLNIQRQIDLLLNE